DQLRLDGVVEHLCLLALATCLARRLNRCAGDIPVVGRILGPAVALVLAPVRIASCAGATLGGLNGVDQLAFAHRPGALDAKGACQLLQLGENHRVQARALAIATITSELLALFAGAFFIWGGTRNLGDFCQRVSLSVRARHRCPFHGTGILLAPTSGSFLEVLSASRRLFSRCG